MTLRERVHGTAFVTAAACIPVGESASCASVAAVVLLLLVRRHEVDWRALKQGPVADALRTLGVWLCAGFAAIVLGRETWLRPMEMLRWSPFLALPLVVLSATCLPRIWLRRAAQAFMISLTAAALLGLLQTHFPGALGDKLPGGFYFHRLKLAHVLLVGVSSLVARQAFARPLLGHRFIELLLLALFSVTLTLTYTRASLLGLAAAVGICIVIAPWRWRLIAFAAACAGGFGLMHLPGVRERSLALMGTEASTLRGVVWSQAVRMIADHPLGVGIGNYGHLIARYYATVDPTFVTRSYAHNVLLASWAETGPVGMLAFAWFWVGIVTLCTRRLREPRGRDKEIAAFGLALAAAFWTVGAIHDVLFHPVVALAFTSALGYVLAFLCLHVDDA